MCQDGVANTCIAVTLHTNEAAIKLLEKPDAAITEDDRAKLRLYTGAGGLTAEDADAGHGILNEHYTAYPVVQAIWDLLGRMGYKAGNVLEPGAGIGNFAGLAPSGARMVMVEKSSVSARIARLLYPEQVTRQEGGAASSGSQDKSSFVEYSLNMQLSMPVGGRDIAML